MNRSAKLAPSVVVFVVAAVITLGFALYTNHVWEDYYITYRSSKNLATGHGLVFNLGDRLHTFTSPIGVLLPALASLLTGNTSDPGALWIFRFICAAALGGAAALLTGLARRSRYAPVALAVVVGGLLSDAKTLDFTINGMETAFMLLFIAYAFWAHQTPGPRQWAHLGAAWAGLMWTRPDSFIYVGLIAAGFWLFNDPPTTGSTRGAQLRLFVRAGLLTTALYLPWLVWAWLYYGTPVPHTITAKSGIGDPHTLGGLISTAVRLPWLTWTKSSSLELTFLPAYYMIGGWPGAIIIVSRTLATLAALLWLFPRLASWARVASFAYFGAHVYLTYFPYFPFPWYIPSTTVLALIALAGLTQWLVSPGAAPGVCRGLALTLAAALLLPNVWSVWAVARQVRSQQQIVEDGNRRQIGEWLHAQSSPGDTIFMEPLGYIGFFSGLKTYDWPGMSSREMVAARRELGTSWGAILRYLQPTWIVLRPFEIPRVEREAPDFLHNYYTVAKDFDRSADVAQLDVHGRRYLEYDSHFIVYHRRATPLVDPAENGLRIHGELHAPARREIARNAQRTTFNQHIVSVVGTPSMLAFPIGDDAASITGGLGQLDRDWLESRKAVPVRFRIILARPDGSEVPLLDRSLNPDTNPEDRGVREFRVDIPWPSQGELRFLTDGAERANAFWSELALTPLRLALDFAGQPVAPLATHAQFGFANSEEDGQPILFAHASSELVYPWLDGMNQLEIRFGVLRGAHTAARRTDGVVFVVEAEQADGSRRELFRRHLDPVNAPTDVGPQTATVALPALPGGRIHLRAEPPASGRIVNAWSYWGDLRVRR
ncbi:MAG: hypothetical protein KF715_06910 [Candidatus Didemnitutus sp.]|nr:hypothetical protein [Candidatus Didemnitutus sp.]